LSHDVASIVTVSNRWLTGRAIKLHVFALLVISVCLALGWWQLHRALDDHNRLSWAYTFEWPFFAAYAGWVWWRLLHEEPGFKATEASEPRQGPPSGDEKRELDAYNDYLAGLHRAGRRTSD
jgi:hypothetical protein